MSLYRFLFSALTIVIVVSFFLPWVSVEFKAISSITKILGAKEGAKFIKISGFSVPLMANSKNSGLIVTLAGIFKPGIQDIAKKSWFVWGLPLLAIILLVLASNFERSRFFNFLFAVIGWGIFLIVFYKLNTVDFNKAGLNINIEKPFWFILYSYLGIGVISLFKIISLNSSRKKM